MSERIDVTPEQTKLIEEYARAGLTWESIGRLLGLTVTTLKRKAEANNAYHRGIEQANVRIANKVYEKAEQGDNACMFFWLKCRARWREKDSGDVEKFELTGKDGEPLWGSAHDKLASLVSHLVKQRGASRSADVADGE